MKNKQVLILVSVAIILLIFLSWKNMQKQNLGEVNYKVEECETTRLSEKRMSVEYNELRKTLVAYVLVNCCGIDVKVKSENFTYKIIEEQHGELCRCVCVRKVSIFNIPKDFKVIFIDKDGKEFLLAPVSGFCGWSTYGECNSDEDCIESGCSAQVCQSRHEEPIFTTCEWRDCYNSREYGVRCKCLEGKCQWSK